ncbi:MAG: glycosyltransferase [Candidatus Sumerlaeota bacterium]|nr:glycosyltransferase [Candidatus Sumerlaeota bacterium]
MQVCTGDRGGGAEGSAWNLFQGYRARGHRSWLAVGRKQTADPDVLAIPNRPNPWSRGCNHLGRRLKPVSSKAPGIETLRKALAAAAAPRKWIDAHRGSEDFRFPGTYRLLSLPPARPSVLHCHNLHGGFFDLRALPWLSRQLPVVLDARDMWLVTGHCAHFFECQRWTIGCGQCPDLGIYPSIQRDGTARNWARKRDIYARSRLYVAAPSRWVIDCVRSSMLHALECRVIPNGIDLRVFDPRGREAARAELGLPSDAPIILFSSNRTRSNPFKDYATLEEAVSRLGLASNARQLHFVCLGEAGETKAVGRSFFHFVGFERDPQRVAQYCRAADVYVHAAKAETFGKSITEALACGTPVVATAVGGIPEQIKGLHGALGSANPWNNEGPDAATGVLVPKGDAQGIARAVELLLRDDDLRKRLGDNAAKDAAQRFSLDRQIDDYLSWYREILSGFGRTGSSD